MTNTAAISVRLLRCPRCGYDIERLPRRHRCPECGFAYDESMFLLEGWRLPDFRRSARDVVRYGGGLALAAVLGLMIGLTLFAVAVFCGAVIVIAAALYGYVALRDSTGSRALVRYLISNDGVARVGCRGRGRIYLWRNYSHLAMLQEGADTWRLHLYPAWWHLFGPPMLNARLEGSSEEANNVRIEIERRIHAARSDE